MRPKSEITKKEERETQKRTSTSGERKDGY